MDFLYSSCTGCVYLMGILLFSSTEACTFCNGGNRYLPDRRKPRQPSTEFKEFIKPTCNDFCRSGIQSIDDDFLKTAPCPPTWNLALICSSDFIGGRYNISCVNIEKILKHCIGRFHYPVVINSKSIIKSLPECRNICHPEPAPVSNRQTSSAGCDGVCIALIMFFGIVIVLCVIFFIAYKKFGTGRGVFYRVQNSIQRRLSRNKDRNSSKMYYSDVVATDDHSFLSTMIPKTKEINNTDKDPELCIHCTDGDIKEKLNSSQTNQTEGRISQPLEDILDDCLLQNYKYLLSDEIDGSDRIDDKIKSSPDENKRDSGDVSNKNTPGGEDNISAQDVPTDNNDVKRGSEKNDDKIKNSPCEIKRDSGEVSNKSTDGREDNISAQDVTADNDRDTVSGKDVQEKDLLTAIQESMSVAHDDNLKI